MDALISIILVNYNGLQFNKICINSILLQSYRNFEIIFVDNKSSDGSVEEVEMFYKNEIIKKRLIVVRNKINTGFTGGNNLGIKYISKNSKYICLLNNDTIVPKNWLEELVRGIKSDNKLGAVGSMILDKGYEKQIKRIYDKGNVFVSTILGENAIERFETKNGLMYTNVLSGCCILYRRNIIYKPFPEFYFGYGEDTWLGFFLSIMGYKVAVCKTSVVNHFGSGSFGRELSSLKLFYGNRNQIINFLLFYNRNTILKLLPLFFINQISHLFLDNSFSRLLAKLRSWKRIFCNRKKIIGLRGFIQKNRKLKDKEMMAIFSHKLSDNIFYANFNKNNLNLINIGNRIFEKYINLFFGILKK